MRSPAQDSRRAAVDACPRCHRAPTRPSMPCSFASTTPTRRVDVSMPSSNIMRSGPQRARRRARARRGTQRGPCATISIVRRSGSSPIVSCTSTRSRGKSGATTSPHSTSTTRSSSISSSPRSCSSCTRSQPVDVDVRDGHWTVVLLHDRERRARDGIAHAERPGHALDERRLARAQVAAEHDEVTFAEKCADARPRPTPSRGRRRVVSIMRAGRAPASTCTKSARASASALPPDRKHRGRVVHGDQHGVVARAREAGTRARGAW